MKWLHSARLAGLSALILLFCATNLVQAIPAYTPGVWKNITPGNDPGSSFGVYTVSIDLGNPSILYTAVDGRGGYKSTDGGSTWTILGNPNYSYNFEAYTEFLDNPSMICADPNNSQHLYAAQAVRGKTMGFWISTDGGATWNIPAGFDATNTTRDVGLIQVDPSDFNHLLVASHSPWTNLGINSSGILESKDGGTTWTVHMPPAMMGSQGNKSVAFLYEPSLGIGNSNTWLVSTDGYGVFRTTDGAASWTKVSDYGGGHATPEIYYAHTGALYSSAALYPLRSFDNGITWEQLNNNGLGYSYYSGFQGDGYRMYTSNSLPSPGNAATGPFMSTLETDGAHWTAYDPFGTGPQTFGNGTNLLKFDKVNRIMYSANWGAGLWAIRVLDPPPMVSVSDTLPTVTYVVGQPRTTKTVKTAIINARANTTHLTGTLAVTNKKSWLSVSVDAAKVDSQVITHTIDASSLSDVEQKYYDTVTVHAGNGSPNDITYRVLLWIRQAPVLTTFSILPSDSGALPSSKPYQFSASALDQYGAAMQPQPTLSWSATGGTISATGLFTPAQSAETGSVTVTAAGSGSISKSISFSIVSCAQGIAYDYYAHAWLASVNDIAAKTVTKSGVATSISLNATIVAADSFAYRFTGYVMIPTSGEYTFTVNSDDGSALYIDGVRIANNDGVHAAQDVSGTLTLGWGLHSISVLYYQALGGLALSASWKGPGFAKTPIPATALSCGSGLAVSAFKPTSSVSTGHAAALSVTQNTVRVNVGPDAQWRLDFFGLNGARVVGYSGRGGSTVSIEPARRMTSRLLVARLLSQAGIVTERISW